MPTIKVSWEDLCNLILKGLTDKKISELPIDVDDDLIYKDELEDLIFLNKGEVESWEGDEIEVEVTSDRIDLLSTEGFARAIRGFLGIEVGLPKYDVHKTDFELLVDPSVNKVRPYIVSGIVEDVEFTDAQVAQIMQQQEKLHATHSRNRKQASIGLHDLDKIEPPITYCAKRPEDIHFIPLHETEEMNGYEILEKVPKGRDYAFIIEGAPVYPLLHDSKGTILSLPPIINSVDTAVTPETRNLFFDITCLNKNIANYALNVLVCNIAERCGKIKSVNIKYPDHIEVLPDLTPNKRELHVDYAKNVLGVDLSFNELKDLILKARMEFEENKNDKNVLTISIPAYRSDNHHEIDVVENISIAYGYNKLIPESPKIITVGEEDPFEVFVRRLTYFLIGLKYQELHNFVMTSKDVLFNKMNLASSKQNFIEIINPISSSFEVLRNDLLPLNLDFLSKNIHAALPINVFEIGNIVKIDESKETKTNQIRQLNVLKTDFSVSFEDIQAVLFSLMDYLELEFNLERNNNPIFIKGRGAIIKVDENVLGDIGEISLGIIKNFGLINPVVSLRLDLTQIYKLLSI
ncbi:MAG: phenylalanine--tRNA ligase subunit beta [Candidatus Lokiarchaeota archaeon]|nr:phenylalanine--tRNA ligase subunit beta [Candidatus Lokiarchaeota archaeon]